MNKWLKVCSADENTNPILEFVMQNEIKYGMKASSTHVRGSTIRIYMELEDDDLVAFKLKFGNECLFNITELENYFNTGTK